MFLHWQALGNRITGYSLTTAGSPTFNSSVFHDGTHSLELDDVASGTDDRVTYTLLDNEPSWSPGWRVDFWLRVASTGDPDRSSNRSIIDISGGATNMYVRMDPVSTTTYQLIWKLGFTGSADTYTTPATVFNTNTWYNVYIQYDSSVPRYSWGTNVAGNTLSGATGTVPPGNTIVFGQTLSSSVAAKWYIDNFRITNLSTDWMNAQFDNTYDLS